MIDRRSAAFRSVLRLKTGLFCLKNGAEGLFFVSMMLISPANPLQGLCLLCHNGPFPEERMQGTLAPDLKGAGSSWSEGQLRPALTRASPTTLATAACISAGVASMSKVIPTKRGRWYPCCFRRE